MGVSAGWIKQETDEDIEKALRDANRIAKVTMMPREALIEYAARLAYHIMHMAVDIEMLRQAIGENRPGEGSEDGGTEKDA